MTVNNYSCFSSISTPHYLLHNTCLEFELEKEGGGGWQQKERDGVAEREIKGRELLKKKRGEKDICNANHLQGA